MDYSELYLAIQANLNIDHLKYITLIHPYFWLQLLYLRYLFFLTQ